ncbi:M20 aminoacylase family protein [Bradyrhizobium sp. NAS96.2]|uniref:M20 aminoacylase family protein n=1 Tax=Bradyrhizobium sp. NAS96.2 TaxID=1680160 RepID=UPI00093F14FA|nr:M20 aminoacylase family protein [Bradyrhizobium sp. NAS96.2]OKO71455.1 amidohydrolase [Bradyrhizobium sp. NAS96.2]
MNNFDAFRPLQQEVSGWRQYLHQKPELEFQVHNTARFVAEKLASFGINHVDTGIAETGVVALIQGKGGDGPTIGLRADMDALPMLEASGKPWSSKVPGKMHACGHDGHTAMLLGAAKYLADTRDFRGTVALIFQPAEENGPGGETGGQRMVREGVMDRFGISRVFGIHNMPGIDIGKFAIRSGALMASQDDFDLLVKGRGGHAAMPHHTVDPVVIAAQIVLGLQALVTRSTDARQPFVISVTRLIAGEAYNVIPEQVSMAGTVRTLAPELRDFAEKQIPAVARAIAVGFGADIEFSYSRSVPVTVNWPEETALALGAARRLVGNENVDHNTPALMIGEDFAYLSEARAGALILIGNGPTAALHNPSYDFCDDALPYGIGYWVNLVEATLAAS